MISLRLNSQLEKELNRAASSKGVTKSEFLRCLIVEKLEEEQKSVSPWQLGKDVFGRFGSGKSDRSLNRKSIVKEKIRAKVRRD